MNQYDIFANNSMQILKTVLKENAALSETVLNLTQERDDLKKQLKELQDGLKKPVKGGK